MIATASPTGPGSGSAPGARVHRRLRWASAAAEAWMVAFALVHAYWLAGGRVGLPAGVSLTDEPALLVIDVVAIPACLAGAALARSLRWPAGRRPSPRLRLRLTAATAAVLVAHALPTVEVWVRQALPGSPALSSDERFVAFLYEPVFLAGGTLCALAALAYRRSGG